MKDDYLANRILRDEMRLKRKSAKAAAITDNALLSKSSLPAGERSSNTLMCIRLREATFYVSIEKSVMVFLQLKKTGKFFERHSFENRKH